MRKTNLLSILLSISVAALISGAANAAMVAWWKMEPEFGEYATDSIGGYQDAHSGTRLYNANGASGQAMSFDGLTTYISRAAANAPSLTGSFSLETWIALQEFPWNWTAIIDRQNNHTSGYLLNVDDSGHLGFSVAAGTSWLSCTSTGADHAFNSILHTNGWTTGSLHTMYRNDGKLQLTVGGVGDYASTANVTAGKWSHVVMTYTTSGTTKRVRFYIDGTLRGSTTISTTQSAILGDLEIGGWDGGGRNFKCYMDDFRLYSRELTATEVTNLNAGSGPTDTIGWWKFDETTGTTAADSTSGTKHNGTLHGCSWLAGKYGNCINMNGIDDYVAVPAIGTYADFSISVWINFNTGTAALPLHQWKHVVATYDTAAGPSIYVNGTKVVSAPGSGTPVQPTGLNLQIGYGRDKQYPTYTERGPSMIGSPMILSGLLDEVKIYNTALTQAEVTAAYNAATPSVSTPLTYWQMPTGQPVTGEFGASYQQLKYSDQWDSVFRSGEAADVQVKFDQMPVNYVFWRGWNYGLCMTTENSLLSCDQSVEWADGYGCVEHMSDKQDRYAHIDIVENNDARVVVRWRYAPCNIMYGLFDTNSTNGFSDWAEEYFYIYPDGVMMREQNTWTEQAVELGYVGYFGGWPSNQETIYFNQPGKYPSDTVDTNPMTIANDAGQTYVWPGGSGSTPPTPTIQMVNFKSTYKPYLIRRPNATLTYWGNTYWNHWPVCQLPNDGRGAPHNDRPGHTSLSWFCEPPISYSGIYYTWTYMYGLTSGTAASLATQSKAWNTPASLTVNSGSYTSQGFKTTQKAYQLTANSAGYPSDLSLTINGSTTSPILNPAIVINGWGDTLPQSVRINGIATPRSTDFRMGINYGLQSNSLVIWLKKQTTSTLTISLTTGIQPPPVVSIGDAKKMSSGTITLQSKIITYAPRDSSGSQATSYFYVEEPNRPAGIRVADNTTGQDDLSEDSQVTLTGSISTDIVTGEKVLLLTSPPIPATGIGTQPFLTITKSAIRDQIAVGQYIRLGGKVKNLAADGLSFDLYDGYGSGIKVKIESGIALNGIFNNDMVTVTGVVSQLTSGQRVILLRKISNITNPQVGPPPTVYYKFDEVSGTTAADSSGFNYNGTLSAGCAWMPGNPNGSLNFTSGYVSVPNLGANLSQFSVSAWVNVHSLPAGSGWQATSLLSSDGWSNGCVALLLLGPNSGTHARQFQLSVCGAPGNDLVWTNYTITDARLNGWIHIAVVYDITGKSAKFYINGALDSSATVNTTQTASLSALKIGSWQTSRYFDGQMDDFRIFNKALSAQEVSDIYNGLRLH